MQCVRPRGHGRPDQRAGGEIGLAERRAGEEYRRVRFTDMRTGRVVGRVDGDGLAAGGMRPADEATGDFAPVRNEQAPDHQCRTTPKTAVPRTGAECTEVKAMASTVRVSRGSMIPSSQRRPVAYCAVDSSSI